MSDVTVKRVEDIDYDRGEKRADGVQFRHAGQELGVTGYRMNVIDLEPRCPNYPESLQDEVIVVLRGSAMLHVGSQHHELVPGVLAHVGAGEARKVEPGPEGATVLVIGSTTSGKALPPAAKRPS